MLYNTTKNLREVVVSISVIIPTLNAEKYIFSLLTNIWAQNLKPSEILVIDSSSDDNTGSIAESLKARVIRISREAFDHGGTRNLAIKKSCGEIIVLLTQDAQPFNSYFIETLISPLKDDSIALSYGRQVPRNDADPIERFVRQFNYPEESIIKDINKIPILGIKTFFCSNVCSAIRRKEFVEVGGFPENIIMNEDMVLAAKLIFKGYKIAYQSSALVLHSHNYRLKEQFQRYFDIGVSISRNKWLLKNIKTESEGIRLIKEQTKYLIAEKKFSFILYGFLQAMMKYSGYRLGMAEEKLPLKLKRSFSMHKGFWKYKNTAFQEAA